MTTATNTSTQAPRGELFADAGAAAVWAAIQHLSETARAELLDQLVADSVIPDSRSNPQATRLARGITALREAQAQLAQEAREGSLPASFARLDPDGVPLLSVDAYRWLYGQHGRRLGWPTDGSLRRWFGGAWNDCLRQANLQVVPDGDALVRSIGGALTREEIITAVRAYVEAIGEELPTLSGFLRWAHRPDVKRLPGRRPLSQSPFERLFGSWDQVLVDAGIVDAVPERGLDRTLTVGGGRKVYPRTARGYTDEDIGAALREVAERLKASPTTTAYAGEREKIFAEEEAAGLPPRAIPSLPLVIKRFGVWDEALRAAGLEPVNGRYMKDGCGKRRSKRRISDEEIHDAIRAAYVKVGNPFTKNAYEQWRAKQIPIDRMERRLRRLPNYTVIYRRYGTWLAACQVALEGSSPEEEAAGNESARNNETAGPETADDGAGR